MVRRGMSVMGRVRIESGRLLATAEHITGRRVTPERPAAPGEPDQQASGEAEIEHETDTLEVFTRTRTRDPRDPWKKSAPPWNRTKNLLIKSPTGG